MSLTILKGTIVSAPALGRLEITEGGYLVAEDTLAQLAEQCDPPITKSALNHRLRKLVELGKEER